MANDSSTINEKDKAPQKASSFQSVHNVLDIFELLSSEVSESGLTEIADTVGIHKSTALRLMRPLVQRGYIIRDEKTKKYRLGFKLLTVSHMLLNNLDIRTFARPFMLELANRTKETVHLAAIMDYEVVYLDKVDTTRTLIMRSKIGLRAPMHCTGLGKAMLSRLNENELTEFLDKTSLFKFTENTVMNKEDLKNDLAEAKTRGYAIDNEEHEYGIKCVAAPILNQDGTVVGAMSIAGPSQNMTDARRSEYGKLIKECSMNVSTLMGYK